MDEHPALTLWREWFEESGDPTYAGEAGGDIYCFFCGAWMEFDPHRENCIYVRAKALVEKSG